MTDLRYSSFNRFEIELTLEQAESGSHQGQCDEDVDALSREPAIAAQLSKLEPGAVRDELREYGAWGDDELADHDQNLQRVLWLACGQITDEQCAQ